jgi:hypothetical protein
MDSIFTYKFFGNKHTFLFLTGLLSLVVSFWLLLYVIPGANASLFNTILGNIILVVSVILVGIKNIKIAIGLAILFIFLFKFSHYVKEDFGLHNSGIYPFALPSK